jgi:hypothetical protein
MIATPKSRGDDSGFPNRPKRAFHGPAGTGLPSIRFILEPLMEAVMSQPDWKKFNDQRGIDAKYRQAVKPDLGLSGPEMVGFAVSPEGPSGSFDAARLRETGAPQASVETILHPASPREDEQFAAIHERQDELKRKDPRVGGTGDTDPKANSKPPSGS